MTFLNPTYLWALLALAIPIVIHLWSKKEGRTIKVGSIQLLDESDSKKTSSIRLNEILLLLLRLLLVTILVFILSEPQLKRKVITTPITYIVEPSLLDDSKIAAVIDTIDRSNVKLLQKGFPDYDPDNSYEVFNVPNYWNLAKEMENLQTDSVVVFTKAFIQGLKGLRPTISSNINWIVFDTESTINERINAENKGDSIKLVSVFSNAKKLSYADNVISIDDRTLQLNKTKDSVFFNDNEFIKNIKINKTASLKTLIYFDDSLRNEKLYVEASLKAISRYIDQSIKIDTRTSDDTTENLEYDLLVWLSGKVPPKSERKVLIYKMDDLAHNLIEKGELPNTFYLTKTLSTDIVVQQHFAEQLLRTLNPNRNLKKHVQQYDKRAVASNEIDTIKTRPNKKSKQTANVSFDKWFWVLFILSLIAERVVSKTRKQ
ncbi:BatA domain-containing protein [Spongiivirga sp. MCCC 1A20706]|uniref:BatA domain-containing protein n=1 Tax=Spongiivirga sp. MCCC 1A20706 TaxID=3160963 RepID=UPI003977C712